MVEEVNINNHNYIKKFKKVYKVQKLFFHRCRIINIVYIVQNDY